MRGAARALGRAETPAETSAAPAPGKQTLAEHGAPRWWDEEPTGAEREGERTAGSVDAGGAWVERGGRATGGGRDRGGANPSDEGWEVLDEGEGLRAGDWPADDAFEQALGLAVSSGGGPAAFVASSGGGGARPAPAGGGASGASARTGASGASAGAGASGPAAAGAGASGASAGAGASSAAGARTGSGTASGARGRTRRSAPEPVPSTDEPAQHATWPQVEAATSDAGKAALDLTWIDALPQEVRDSIDVEFSEAARQQATKGRRGTVVRAIEAERKRRLQQLRVEAEARLAPTTPRRARAQALEADPEYRRKVAALAAELELEQRRQLEQVAADADAAPRRAGQPVESVTSPPGAKIDRLQGAARARTDFMSWAIEMTGSADKAKAHYQSIRQVAGRPGLWLAADAAARFEAAIRAFEAAHPGYTIGSTGGYAQRGLHQQRWGVGMHGHSLALAIDILAYDNPNLKAADGDPPHLNHFFLKRFGRDEQGKARATMNLGADGDERIEALGKHTAQGTTTAQDEALVAELRQQFGELSSTSRRFQASMAANLPALQGARNHYFVMKELAVELARTEAALANAQALARKQVERERVRDPAARASRVAEVEAELRERLAAEVLRLKERHKRAGDAYRTNMAGAFGDWRASLEQDLAAADASLAAKTVAGQAAVAALAALGAIADDVTALREFGLRHAISAPTASNARALRRRLESELRARVSTAQGETTYASKEVAVLRAALKRLDEPDRVFGQPEKQQDGVYATSLAASELPLVQFIERGFVRDDAMPPSAGGGRKGVFNAEVVATLARYGFSPGSTFGDTMHFDFIEGYSATVPGGRNQVNMRRNRFGPRGTIHEGPQ